MTCLTTYLTTMFVNRAPGMLSSLDQRGLETKFNGLVVVVLVLVLVLIIIVLVLMHLGLVVSKFDYAKYLLLLANQFDCVTDTSKTAKIIKKVILFNSTLTVRRCDGE